MTTDTMEKANRLIKAATGEPYGDGYTVTDVCVGYAEPGYGSDESVIVFGNWNPKRFARAGDAPLTKAESLPERLSNALERIGAEVQWCDEWTTCIGCARAIRTEGNSYHWRPFYTFIDEEGCLCGECALKDLDAVLPLYLNNASNAITWATTSDLEAIGFVQWEPGNPQRYESGWHEGMNADPSTILASIDQDTYDVVFLLDEASQFYVGFSAWVRPIID
jgi:hypothetical protein